MKGILPSVVLNKIKSIITKINICRFDKKQFLEEQDGPSLESSSYLNVTL